MSFDLVPAELLASALTAVLLSIPFSFVLAGAAISGPRRTWNRAGLAMGIGLLIGVLLAAATLFALPLGPTSALLDIGMLLGLACAIVAAVLVIIQDDGTTVSTVLGVIACVLIGLAVPADAMRAILSLSSSVLVLIAAMVIEAVALAAIVGFLVAGAGRVRALQIGVAAAGIVSAVLIGEGVLAILLRDAAGVALPQASLTAMLITALVALVIGSVVGGVLDTVRSRRQVEPIREPR
ncbi:hypothetical protein CFK39_08890 [Brachybacterium avium]|uniref:Uncharacterized protein n=1 Tax=Brachybacterium avium TaxID=2017485 RepID=A0A220UCV3_9MICO|nr:hypothetical protein [Brachybacterium avium]ASK65925.1 hypothetical protein CFK39_08890 [Brachybacterium avium]